MKQYSGICLLASLIWATAAAAAEPIRSTGDPDLPADLVASWGPQTNFFLQRGFTIIEWPAAQVILREGLCAGGKQYHTGWLTMYLRDGRRYLVRPPALDDFLAFMRENSLDASGFAPE